MADRERRQDKPAVSAALRAQLNDDQLMTLRNLERDGLLARHYFPEVPPRVEYELSAMGRGMLPALEAFTGWIRSHWPAIVEARQAFDAAGRDGGAAR